MNDFDAPMFTDPAVIMAMSCCWLYRTNNAGSVVIARQVMDRHGEVCCWCDYKPVLLMDYIEEFWHWSADHGNRPIVDWERLPKAVQHDRVLAALVLE